MKRCLIILLLALPFCAVAQNQNSVWCFGDSALIDFSDTSNIITGSSSVKSRGSCASICDSSGQLLFYAYTRAGIAGNTTIVLNSNNLLMQNGDSIIGEGWYFELVIIPFPGSDSLYYLFSIGETGSSQLGLYYSIINITSNGNLGLVIQKNILLQNFKCSDGLTAIKHGNGLDWWIIFRRWDFINDTFYKYLVSYSGISGVFSQNIGTLTDNGLSRIQFNKNGTKMMFYNYRGLTELYDFDRCTGELSNLNNIHVESFQLPLPQRWNVVFSPSNNILYETDIAASSSDSCYLIQYDLTATNIAATADTLWRTPFMMNMGQLKLAPDGKIYLAHNYYGGYPYADTTYNTYNSYLSVINYPDSLGQSCSLQPYSFYLGGKRTYWGLPNNPDYALPALAGSGCDTITGSPTLTLHVGEGMLFVYYHAGWQKAFINAQKLKGKNYHLRVTDMLGNVVFNEQGNLQSAYFSMDVNCESFAKGMYVVTLQTEKERLVKKFVKE